MTASAPFDPQDFVNAAAKTTGEYRRSCGCRATAIEHGCRQYIACQQHAEQWIADRIDRPEESNLR